MEVKSSALARRSAHARLLLVSLMATTSCQAQNRDKIMAAEIEPSVFASVEVNIEGPVDCTPPRPSSPEWTGILLSAPDRVRSDGTPSLVVPLCVRAVLPVIVPAPPMTIVAIDRAKGTRYTGPAFPHPLPEQADDSTPNPMPPPLRAQHEVEGMTAEIAFTADLVGSTKIPGDGVFDVHIERGGITSEPVAVEIEMNAQP